MLHKDIFTNNVTLKQYLVEALVVEYADSERTSYYQKFSLRYFSCVIFEFIWPNQVYKDSFEKLGKEKPGLFIEFCNFMIKDINDLLFEGLILLEEIKNFEEIVNTPEWHQYDLE